MPKVSSELVDAADLISEAINLVEAAYMACLDISDPQSRNALRGITGKASEIARLGSEKLQDEIERMREATDV